MLLDMWWQVFLTELRTTIHRIQLDLHRIHCVLEDVKRLRKEGLHFLQITASNGRGSALFSLPEKTRWNSLLSAIFWFDHVILSAMERSYMKALGWSIHCRWRTSSTTAVKFSQLPFSPALSRMFHSEFGFGTTIDPSITWSGCHRFASLFIQKYDVKTMPYVNVAFRVPSKHGSKKVLENQRAGYVRPLSYLLKNSGFVFFFSRCWRPQYCVMHPYAVTVQL